MRPPGSRPTTAWGGVVVGGLRRRCLLALDPGWLHLDLSITSPTFLAEGVGFGRRPLS
jgi:hypothetical protein